MQVSELWSFSLWLKSNIEKSNLPPRFNQAKNEMQGLVSINSSLENLIGVLGKALSQIENRDFNEKEKEILENMGIDDIFRSNPLDYIEEVFRSDLYSKNEILKKLATSEKRLTQGLNDLKSLTASIPNLINKDELSLIHHEESENAVIRVVFQGRSEIENPTQLKDWSKRMYTILRGFSFIGGNRIEDIKIKNTGKGSHWFELAADPTIIKNISLSVVSMSSAITGVISTMIAYQKLKQEVKKNKKLEEDLDKEIEKIKEQKKEESIEKEVERIKKEKVQEEYINEIESALRALYELLYKDGTIEIKEPAKDEELHNYKGRLLEEFKRLKDEQKLIENNTGSDNTSEESNDDTPEPDGDA